MVRPLSVEESCSGVTRSATAVRPAASRSHAGIGCETISAEATCTDRNAVGACPAAVFRPHAATSSDPPRASPTMARRKRAEATGGAYIRSPEIWARSGDNLAVYGGAGWHDFFLMVGGGAAALTGLVFVAMSLHLDQIALHAAHRHRARTVLTGLTAVFIRCRLILMAGQSAQMAAAGVILVLLVVQFVLYRSIRQATAASNVPDPALVWRTTGSFACLVLETVGAVGLLAGDARGLYVVSVGMMASFTFMVSGAWLLIVGVRREEAAQATG